MITVIKVTLSIFPATWRAFRIACLQHEISASKQVELLMKAQLQTWEQQEHARKNT
jgi:hypothetical protein